MTNKLKVVATITLCVLLSSLFLMLSPLVSAQAGVGYSQGTQGFNFSFDNVYWNNHWWSNTEFGTSMADSDPPSQRLFGSQLDLNPDSNQKGMPGLHASQGTFYVDITNSSGLNRSYPWMIPNGTAVQNGKNVTVYEQYEMRRILCNMSFEVWLSGTGSEAQAVTTDAPNWYAQIWITLTPNSFVYYNSNPNHVYFAPAYIGLTNDSVWSSRSYGNVGGGTFTEDQFATMIGEQDINPRYQGNVMGIYYARGGTPVDLDQSVYNYRGQALDPAIFRSVYYTVINVGPFVAYNNWGLFWYPHLWIFPCAHLDLTMYVYVIGQWEIYFQAGETPVQKPHSPPFLATAPSAFSLSTIFFILIAVIIVAIVIYIIYKSYKSRRR